MIIIQIPNVICYFNKMLGTFNNFRINYIKLKLVPSSANGVPEFLDVLTVWTGIGSDG